MTLRTQRWLLRTVIVMVVAVTAARCWHIMQSDAGNKRFADAEPVAQPTSLGDELAVSTVEFGDLTERRLRRPLYDPPPPPPKVEEKPPPTPLRVKLVGTIIEPTNPQAILETDAGQVVFRKIGEPLSEAVPGVVIDEILTGEVRYTREGQVLSLTVGQTAN